MAVAKFTDGAAVHCLPLYPFTNNIIVVVFGRLCGCIVTEVFGIEAVRSMLQQVAQNPQLMTNMLQAPYVQAMLQSISTNPSLVLQVSCSLSLSLVVTYCTGGMSRLSHHRIYTVSKKTPSTFFAVTRADVVGF